MSIFEKLAAQESEFFNSEIFSPVLRGSPIRVRLASIICSLKVQPPDFQGWGVFTAKDCKNAQFLREPTMKEKQQYFNLFPTLRFILLKNEGTWYGMPAHSSDTRFKIAGTVPIQLATEVQIFDTVSCRFDGIHVWYEQIDPKHSFKNANYLRQKLNEFTPADKLDSPGLSIEEKDVYRIALNRAIALEEELKKDKNEERIKDALRRAGAKYESYIERGNTYTIEYRVGREKHRSVVNKDTLAVESAGICLSGGDRNFDLQSLVGVIREGQNRHAIVRVGDNRDNTNYGLSQDYYESHYGGDDDDWE